MLRYIHIQYWSIHTLLVIRPHALPVMLTLPLTAQWARHTTSSRTWATASSCCSALNICRSTQILIRAPTKSCWVKNLQQYHRSITKGRRHTHTHAQAHYPHCPPPTLPTSCTGHEYFHHPHRASLEMLSLPTLHYLQHSHTALLAGGGPVSAEVAFIHQFPEFLPGAVRVPDVKQLPQFRHALDKHLRLTLGQLACTNESAR